MANAKRKRNIWPFGKRQSPSNYLPARGGIAQHMGTSKPKAKTADDVVATFKGHDIVKRGRQFYVPSLDPGGFGKFDDAKLFVASITGGGKVKNPGRTIIPVKIKIEGGKVRVFATAAAIRKMNPTPSYREYAHDWGDEAYQAGRQWRMHGAHSSGVANSRVVRYGFLKWFNDQASGLTKTPRSVGGKLNNTKAYLEKSFREGYRSAR